MTRLLTRTTLLVALAAAAAGCDNQQTSPLIAAPSPVIARDGPSVLRGVRGHVQDTSFRGLADAHVEVVSGPLAGMSSTTDQSGWFTLGGEFDGSATFRASKDGYVEQTGSAAYCDRCNPASYFLSLTVAAVGPVPDLGGDYELTMTADARCATLPVEVRHRSYRLRVPPTGAGGAVVLIRPAGATFEPGQDQIALGVSPDYVSLWITSLDERISATTAVRFVELGGGAAIPFGPGPIEIDLEGSVWHCPVEAGVNCITAANKTACVGRHQAVLTRQ